MNKFTCCVCQKKIYELVSNFYSPIIAKKKFEIVICKSCGHLSVYPKPSLQEYNRINKYWYTIKFSITPPSSDPTSKFDRWEQMWERFDLKNTKINTVLDIGSGQGWGLEFLKKKKGRLKLYAIEQYKKNWPYLENMGCHFFDINIDEPNWSQNINVKFDFIILRHTLEHLRNPNICLQEISKVLSLTGLVYIVVPDSLGINQKRISTSYFRPVHLNYFNKVNFLRICYNNNLFFKLINTSSTNLKNSEIYGFFRKKTQSDKLEFDNTYLKQVGYIKKKIRVNYIDDLKIIIQIKIKSFKIIYNFLKFLKSVLVKNPK